MPTLDLGYIQGPPGPAGEEVYSTSETKIGTWIDNNPLYRKVITGKLPSAFYTATPISSIPPGAKVHNIYGTIQTDDKNIISVPCDGILVGIIGNDLTGWVTEDALTWLNASAVITIEYTKTQTAKSQADFEIDTKSDSMLSSVTSTLGRFEESE